MQEPGGASSPADQPPLSVALVAMPGAGKSTLGRILGRHWGLPFRDADHEIEREVGMSVREFFSTHGEPAFRDLEEKVLKRLSQQGPMVLATGGGAVLREANRETLRRAYTVVYLRTSAEELGRRLRHDRSRPLLQVADPMAKLRELFRDRDPLYRKTAHFVIEMGRPSVQSLANMVLMQLELAGLADPFGGANKLP